MLPDLFKAMLMECIVKAAKLYQIAANSQTCCGMDEFLCYLISKLKAMNGNFPTAESNWIWDALNQVIRR
jgi:hypothetical protein